MNPALSQIAEYLELESKATLAPWNTRWTGNWEVHGRNGFICESNLWVDAKANVEFIASSRDIGVKCARALLVALKALAYYEQKEYESATMTDGLLQFTAEEARNEIDSIFNPKDIAKLDGGALQEPAAEKVGEK